VCAERHDVFDLSRYNGAPDGNDSMTKFTPKEERKLLISAKRLFSTSSLLIPKSISDIPPKQDFARELRLTANRIVFLTDSGYEYFRTVVDVMDRANFFEGMADFSDICKAWRRVVETWLSSGLEPKRTDEVVQAIAGLVAQEVDDHTFVVPLFGIELDGVDSFTLGDMTVLSMSVDVLDSAGVEHGHADVPHLLELNKNYLWLQSTVRGTPSVARQRFSEQATLTAGMLAITAASMYEWGTCDFRIGIVMSSEEAIGRSVWFSWRERDRSLTTHYASPGGQPFPVNKALADESDMVRMIYRAFAILPACDRTELEEAIAKAVYWYSDAYRDPVLVMKLIKYWSCVEAFFSFEKEEITHAVSAGLASILVFGGFRFVPPSEYSVLKRQIVYLYGLRSRAVHRGSHKHITERDVAQFSQWVAWMIIIMVALVERGYTTLKEVKAQTERLDGLKDRRERK
jgi:hypothetical protein